MISVYEKHLYNLINSGKQFPDIFKTSVADLYYGNIFFIHLGPQTLNK